MNTMEKLIVLPPLTDHTVKHFLLPDSAEGVAVACITHLLELNSHLPR